MAQNNRLNKILLKCRRAYRSSESVELTELGKEYGRTIFSLSTKLQLLIVSNNFYIL